MQDTIETMQTIESLQATFEELAVRGLRSVGPEYISRLNALAEALETAGASHMPGRIRAIVTSVQNGSRDAGTALLKAQSSLRVFERLLTLETASNTLDLLATHDDEYDFAGVDGDALDGDEADDNEDDA